MRDSSRPPSSPWPRPWPRTNAPLTGPYGDVVGPFLCPATRLDELDACVASGATRPSAIGIIGYAGQLDWRRPMATRGVVQAEAPLGAGMPVPPGRIVPYLELPHRGAVGPALDEVVQARARAKVRCGGLTDDAVPTVEWLAEVLVGCVERGLQLKATAGLHHAFRAGRHEAPRHGFVNLLAAAAVARSRAPVGEVAAVLAAEEADAGDLPGRVAGARELSRRSARARSTSPSASWRCEACCERGQRAKHEHSALPGP